MIERVIDILRHIDISLLGKSINILAFQDKIFGDNGRIYLQVKYECPCTKTGTVQEWAGRKWYLSEFMTADEIVKTAYAAFKMAVEHKVMEGFKYDGRIVFNPHTDFQDLIKIDGEVRRV